LTRLEDLIGEVTQRVPYRAIAQAINVVVFIERAPTGRRVRDVSRVVGRDGQTYRLETFEVGLPPGDGGLLSADRIGAVLQRL
jgi:Flp pilus assembly CpaF family ATPase